MIRYRSLLCCWMLGTFFCTAVHSQEKNATTAPEPAEIQSVITTLENPVDRARLIAQIKILAQAQQKMAPPPETPTLGSTTVELLKTLSDKITESIETTVEAATMFHQLPRVAGWLERQILDLDRRNLWLDIIEKLAGVMGSAYLAFFIVRRSLKHLGDVLQHYPAPGLTMRILSLFALLLLALMPIILFVIAGYLAMGLIRPAENIRLVATIWINAAVIVDISVSIMRFLFAPQYPQLRLLPVSDATSLTIERWGRWLSMIMAYGYFGLQAALLIGMPLPLYETLLRLLGLLVTGLIVLMILRNRGKVAQSIRGRDTLNARELHPRQLLRQFSSVWHVVAIIYVLMLYGVWALALTGGFFFILKGTLVTVLILIAGNAMIWFIENGFHRKFQIGEAWCRRYPRLESRFNRYLPVLQVGVKGLVYVLITLSVLQVWSISAFVWITTGIGKTFSAGLMKVGGIILTTLLIWEVVTLLIEGYLGTAAEKTQLSSARQRTLFSVAQNALFFVLTTTSTLIVLSELGINIVPLLTGAGVAGIAIGIGAQKLVQDIITGIFILLENLIAVGDVISVADKDGLVEALTIRTVRLRDVAGNVHTIPYSSIGPITNKTRDFSYYVFDVAVSYREDIDGVMNELATIGQVMMMEPQYASIILEPLEILGVDSFVSDSVMIKARIKTLPGKQWEVGREFNRRMKKRFDQLSIEMSLPRLSISMEGNPQSGVTPVSFQNTHRDQSR